MPTSNNNAPSIIDKKKIHLITPGSTLLGISA